MADKTRPEGMPEDAGNEDDPRGLISRKGWSNTDDNRNPTEPTSPDELIEEDPMRAPGLDDPEKMVTE